MRRLTATRFGLLALLGGSAAGALASRPWAKRRGGTDEGRRNPAVGYQVVPYPRLQHQMTDWLELMHRRHLFHGLLELDVTDARAAIRQRRARTGEPLSFTAFLVGCLARAIDEDKRMHAYRKGRGELVLFDDVDVTVLVESDVEGAKIPVPHIVRSANRKGLTEISREIRSAQSGDVPYAAGRRWLPAWLLVPGVLRRFFWVRLLADPHRRKRITGTTVVTAVGMFGRGVGWAIPPTDYTLSLAVGGIARKPGVVRDGGGEGRRRGGGGGGGGGDGGGVRGERIAVREYLHLTLSLDHDVIDGAPAARFAMRLKELIESGAGVVEAAPERAETSVPAAAPAAGPVGG